MKRLLFATFMVACFTVFCTTPAILTPPTGPGTEWPCGIGGVSCGNHMCCPEKHVCGDGTLRTQCAAGQCCYVGD